MQCTAIAQSIPELSRRLHLEIDELEAHVKESGKRIEDHQVGTCYVLMSCVPASPLAGLRSQCLTPIPTLNSYQPDPQEFFTKLCSDTTAMAFEIEDLATSASTRADRNLNLGARLAQAIKSHEDEVRGLVFGLDG